MPTNLPHWDAAPWTWDLLFIAAQPMPGVWDVEDGNVKRVIDIKKGPGLDGATIKDQGCVPGEFTLSGQLCSEDDWDTLQSIYEGLLAIQRKKQREPVQIHHPKLALLGITKVYLTEVEIPRLDNGIMTARIRVLQWTEKPKKVGGTKRASKVSLLDEFRFENNQPWLRGHMTDEDAAAQLKAFDGFVERQKRGEIPNFKGNVPQYVPR